MNRIRDLLFGASFAMAGLTVVATFAPRTAAAGWLVGFVLWSQIPVGSLVLLMIHRLTGGRWGEALYPAFASAARSVPLLFVLILPVLVALPLLVPWVDHAGGVDADVASYYLNAPFFITRSLIAIACWSVLAFLLPRVTGPSGQVLAAVGLVFHAVIVSVVSVDWILSIKPPFISSSFGASVAITQLIAALAWAVLWTPPRATDHAATGDIGGLLLAFLLAITYVDFMAFLVMWYSDLPSRMSWFLERDQFPWSLLAAGAFIFVSVAPILALLLAHVRNRIRELRGVAITVLAGLALYYAWLVAPPFRGRVLAAAVLAIIAIGLVLAAATGRRTSNAVIPGRARHGT
jgi:hypothetical protein